MAEGWAEQAAEAPGPASWEVWRAAMTLGWLAQAYHGAAESVLIRLTRHSDSWIRSIAIWKLSESDRAGAHRELFRMLAREGVEEAFEALSYREDPQAMEILRKARAQEVSHYYAEEVLLRLEALPTGRWEALAKEAILGEPNPLRRADLRWALRIGQMRHAGWLRRTLRMRLAKAYDGGDVYLGGGARYFEMRDDAFDDILLTLPELGDKLDPIEEDYLRRFGYSGEPRQRLAEILEEKEYPR